MSQEGLISIGAASTAVTARPESVGCAGESSQRKDEEMYPRLPSVPNLIPELMWKVVHHLGDDLLDHLPVDHVVNTKHSFNYDTEGYFRRRLRGSLKPWFDDPKDLLGTMRETEAVISGSFVLRFVLGIAEWQPRNLDLYVCTGHPTRLLRNFVTASGFDLKRVANNPRFHPDRSDVKRIWLYQKPRPRGPTAYLDIIETSARRAFAPVFRFHLTCLMNFMTWDGIYILYPALTFSMRALVHPRENQSHVNVLQQPQYVKYRERGFTILQAVEDLDADCGDACPGLWRSVADVGCFVCLFRDGGSDVLGCTVDMESMTWTWTVDGDMPRARCQNPKCTRTPLMYPRHDGFQPVTPYSDENTPADINNMNQLYLTEASGEVQLMGDSSDEEMPPLVPA